MKNEAQESQCRAATKKGTRCKNSCVLGTYFCWRHVLLREKIHPGIRITRWVGFLLSCAAALLTILFIFWPEWLDKLHPPKREIRLTQVSILSKISSKTAFFCDEGTRMANNTFGSNPAGVDWVFPEAHPDTVQKYLRADLAIIVEFETIVDSDIPVTQIQAELRWNSRRWKRVDSVLLRNLKYGDLLGNWPILLDRRARQDSLGFATKHHALKGKSLTRIVDTLIMVDTNSYIPLEINTIEEQLGQANSFYVDMHRSDFHLLFFTDLSLVEQLSIPRNSASLTLSPSRFKVDSTLCLGDARYSAITIVLDTVIPF